MSLTQKAYNPNNPYSLQLDYDEPNFNSNNNLSSIYGSNQILPKQDYGTEQLPAEGGSGLGDISSTLGYVSMFKQLGESGADTLAPKKTVNGETYRTGTDFNVQLAGILNPRDSFERVLHGEEEGFLRNVAGVALPGLSEMLHSRDVKEMGTTGHSSLSYSDRPDINYGGTFKDGGPLSLTKYYGPSHQEGGIAIRGNAEVEGGETKGPENTSVENYIFSNTLLVPKTKVTFADKSKYIEKRYSNRPDDKWVREAKSRELQNLMMLNEEERIKKKDEESKEYAKGGYLGEPVVGEPVVEEKVVEKPVETKTITPYTRSKYLDYTAEQINKLSPKERWDMQSDLGDIYSAQYPTASKYYETYGPIPRSKYDELAKTSGNLAMKDYYIAKEKGRLLNPKLRTTEGYYDKPGEEIWSERNYLWRPTARTQYITPKGKLIREEKKDFGYEKDVVTGEIIPKQTFQDGGELKYLSGYSAPTENFNIDQWYDYLKKEAPEALSKYGQDYLWGPEHQADYGKYGSGYSDYLKNLPSTDTDNLMFKRQFGNLRNEREIGPQGDYPLGLDLASEQRRTDIETGIGPGTGREQWLSPEFKKNLGYGASYLGQNVGNIYDIYRGAKGPDDVNYDRISPETIDLGKERERIIKRAIIERNIGRRNISAVAPGKAGYLSNVGNVIADVGRREGEGISRTYQTEESINTQIKNEMAARNAHIQMLEADARQKEVDAARSAVSSGLHGVGTTAGMLGRDVRQEGVQRDTMENWMGTANYKPAIDKKGWEYDTGEKDSSGRKIYAGKDYKTYVYDNKNKRIYTEK